MVDLFWLDVAIELIAGLIIRAIEKLAEYLLPFVKKWLGRLIDSATDELTAYLSSLRKKEITN